MSIYYFCMTNLWLFMRFSFFQICSLVLWNSFLIFFFFFQDMTHKMLDDVIQTSASIIFSSPQYKSCKRRKRGMNLLHLSPHSPKKLTFPPTGVGCLSSSSYFPSLSHSFVRSFNNRPPSTPLPSPQKMKNFPNLEVQPSKFVGWSVEREIEEEWVVWFFLKNIYIYI